MRPESKPSLAPPHPFAPAFLAAALALCPGARAAEPSEESCDPDDDEAALCVQPPASPPAAADAGGPEPEARAGPEAAIGAARARLRPARVKPGDFFEIVVEGPDLRSAAGSFRARSVPMFPAGPGVFRGFGAVPLDWPAGPALVFVAVVDAEMAARSAPLALQVDERAVRKTTISVSSRFTSPSDRQRAQMRADAKAIAASYRVEYGPALFAGNFVDPIGHRRGSRFGEKRVFNGRTKSRHWGLDIDGDAGEPVRAANDGVVTLARPCFMSGLTVLLSHGGGLFTGYFHFSKFAVEAGQKVRRGDVLGYVGSTGRSTGPHLHFAAKLHETLIDPEALLDFDFEGWRISAPLAPDAGLAAGADAGGASAAASPP